MFVTFCDVFLWILRVLCGERKNRGPRVKQDSVMNIAVGVRVAMGGCALPDYLILEVLLSEDFIQQHLHIVDFSSVQVDVDATVVAQE